MAINQHNIVKKGLLAIILGFLWLIILQDLFEFKQVRLLFGYSVSPKDTVFTIQGWKEGKFQQQREKFLQEEFSLREDYVRLHNSIQYQLFHTSPVSWIVFGKQHQLLTSGHVEAYLGKDSVAAQEIHRKTWYLLQIQDTLTKLNKRLYVAIPPTKIDLFPEYIPSSFPKKNEMNNYEKYSLSFRKKGVNHIDFVEYFKKLRAKGNDYLFAVNGSHWNYFGAAKALQYFVQEVNKDGSLISGNIMIKSSHFKKEEKADPDIFASLNLIRQHPTDTNLYPEIEVIPGDSIKPRTIFITDSYFDHWIDHGIYEITDSTTYYFYNNRIINKDRTETSKKFTSEELLNGFDLYVIMCNTSNLDELGWGFIEQLYFYFYPLAPNRAYYDPVFRKKVYAKIKKIKNDKEMFQTYSQRAAYANMRLEEYCYREAVIELQQQIILSNNPNGF